MNKDKGKFIVVSNRLPVTIYNENGKWMGNPSSGGLVKAMNPVLRNRGGAWIGWPGITSRQNISAIREILGPLSDENGYRFLPVSLTKEDIEEFYHGFSNSILWPLFHDLQGRCSFIPSYWDGYIRSNAKFANVILKHSTEKDFIWINDYQLIPLGYMLMNEKPLLRTSFFLHIPFPSPDVFLKLPWRKEILSQMTHYSLVCFQTQRDRRNFIDCLRIFFPDAEVSGRGHVLNVKLQGRKFLVGSMPISIDYKHYSTLGSSHSVISRAKAIREEIAGEKFILGVDRLDYSKGIPEKLKGFERCLELYPEVRGRITLYQIVVPSRDSIPEYKSLKNEIELLISQINGKYATTRWIPVNWRYGSVSDAELSSMYRAADIALITSLKDGMNLVCKEYCASKGKDSGILILSEFAGAAIQLSKGALLVNPYDANGIAAAIYKAFLMEENEKIARMRFMKRTIYKHDVFWWVNNFLRAATGKKLEDFPEQSLPSLWPGIFSDESISKTNPN